MTLSLSDFRADLDWLLEDGQVIILRRVTGSGPSQSRADARCRAIVRRYMPHELTANISQGDSLVILSATDIDAAGWPGSQPAGPAPDYIDPRIPIVGDQVVIDGLARVVKAATPIRVAGELVRIDLQVRG